jgi:hypothetical protein
LAEAASWDFWPIKRKLEGEVTVTDATGPGVTVRAAVPAFASTEAVIVATPGLTAVRIPSGVMVATEAGAACHKKTFPGIRALLASRAMALKETVPPAATLNALCETAT